MACAGGGRSTVARPMATPASPSGPPWAAPLVALALFAITAAVNLQYPLYAAYMDAAGFGFALRTAGFAVYVLGVVPVMACCGGASDAIGRTIPLCVGLLAAGLSVVVMMVFPCAQALFAARLLQGVAVALCFGAGTACLAEQLGDARRAAWWAALTTSLGFGGGALLTGLVAVPGDLQPPSYPLVLGLVVCAGITLLLVPRRPPATPGASWLRLPFHPAGTLPYTAGIGIAWSVSGIVVALAPHLLRHTGHASWAGFGLFALCGAGAAVQVLPRVQPRSPVHGVVAGAACSAAAYLLLLAGACLDRPLLVVAAAGVAGASGFGFMYLAGLTAVTVAGGQRRAAAVSGFLLWAYVGFGGPCIAVGAVADRLDLPTALLAMGVPLLAALGWIAWRITRPAAPPDASAA